MKIFSEIDPIYLDFMATEGNQKVLYVHVTQAIYRMLVSAMIFYYKLTKAMLSYSFEKMVNGEQLTACWHLYNLKSSHIDPKVNNKFSQWIKDTFEQLSEVKTT